MPVPPPLVRILHAHLADFGAIELLRGSRLHGHKYAIDAVVAATALRAVRPVLILASDEDDMSRLCGKTVKIVGL